MQKPKILVTMPAGSVFDTFFDEELISQLEAIGSVDWNDLGRQFTTAELAEKIQGINICLTGWGCPILDETIMASADVLQLVAHNAGSIRPYVTDDVYEKGVSVCSGNRVFAKSVAEGVIAYILAVLRDIPRYSTELKAGKWPESFDNRGLLHRSVGIVGFGMIAEYLVQMLQVFNCPVKVYSRHISQETLEKYNMQKASLEDIFASCDIVSIHSGMTPENHHLITRELLESMKDEAVIVNTARGAVIDEAALAEVLKKKNIYAALDVYEVEPLPKTSPLLSCKNVMLMPHMGGPTIDLRKEVSRAIMRDMQHYLNGEELECEIGCDRASKMSRF